MSDADQKIEVGMETLRQFFRSSVLAADPACREEFATQHAWQCADAVLDLIDARIAKAIAKANIPFVE